jgi:hypothetical protein
MPFGFVGKACQTSVEAGFDAGQSNVGTVASVLTSIAESTPERARGHKCVQKVIQIS